MIILVTGSAGFIGSELCIKLLDRGDIVVGLDNHNDYYDQNLKETRLKRYLNHPNYIHLRLDISDSEALEEAFESYKPARVVNLAAQAGVRYSIENPNAYIQSNIVGFLNVLECCRKYQIEHLVYASSSSVYGANTSVPFSSHDNVDHPISLYAASKKSNELMAHTYSSLHKLPTTGLRFFTVYGPWGRPDMAPIIFSKAIISGNPIKVFNYGNHRRDFTYIDDIIIGVIKVLDKPATENKKWSGLAPEPSSSFAPYCIYNIGNNEPIKLLRFINILEDALGRKADIQLMPLQPGDVVDTFADVSELVERFDYKPSTKIENGVQKFADWFINYYSE